MVITASEIDTPRSHPDATPVPHSLHGSSPSNNPGTSTTPNSSANTEGRSVVSQSTTSNATGQESGTLPGTSTQATTPNAARQDTQTSNTTADSADDASPGCNGHNARAATPEDNFTNLRLEHAKALENNKRKATENLSSSKKQKKAEPNDKNTLKYAILPFISPR